MAIELIIKDSNGVELSLGDFVLMQSERNGGLSFIAQVQIIKGQLFPFNKFSYDRIVYQKALPEGYSHCPSNSPDEPEYWMHKDQELALIQDNALSDYRMGIVAFENNDFYSVREI